MILVRYSNVAAVSTISLGDVFMNTRPSGKWWDGMPFSGKVRDVLGYFSAALLVLIWASGVMRILGHGLSKTASTVLILAFSIVLVGALVTSYLARQTLGRQHNR